MSEAHWQDLQNAPAAAWAFFTAHSEVSDPGAHNHKLAALQLDPENLVDCFGRMVLNFVTDRTLVSAETFKSRMYQIDLRYVTTMLDALQEIADLPLLTKRRPDQRIVGNCRDGALLCVAALRACAIPARVRIGYGHRFYDPSQPLHEHAVVELFDGRWHALDCRANGETLSRYEMPLRVGDYLSAGQFHTALSLWSQCRQGRRDFAEFSGEHQDRAQGMCTLAKYVYHDIAALNGIEPLMWDVWGPLLYRTAPTEINDNEELSLLDRFAALNPDDPTEWAQMHSLYGDNDLVRMPATVVSYSPQNGLQKWHRRREFTSQATLTRQPSTTKMEHS